MATSGSESCRKQVVPLADMHNKTIGYCTDVEGNLDYWKRYINISKVLEESKNGVVLKENCYFVYGGDICDRGPGDIRVMRDVINLKKSHPDRVHIVLGNRDVNKMRLLTELQEEFVAEPARTYWMGEMQQTGDLVAPNRLKAIFEQTMGAPGAFEYRRQELCELQMESGDDDVVRSFKESVYPEGDMLEYLKLGTLAVKLGDVLFIHGGTHDNSVGWIPPAAAVCPSDPSVLGGSRATDVDMWCESLEAFRCEEMEAFSRYSCDVAAAPASQGMSVYGDKNWSAVGGYGHVCPGSRLMQYGMGWMPDKSVNPTMVYDNFLDDGAPKSPSDMVTRFLTESGVLKLVVGHQPHGDAPVVIDNNCLQIITGDTSYARGVLWGPPDSSAEQLRELDMLCDHVRSARANRFSPSADPADTRGVAVSEVLFKFGAAGAVSHTHIHGYLQNGLDYNFELPPVQTNDIIGKVTADEWWVKARMTRRYTGAESAGIVTRLRSVLPCCGSRSSRIASSDDDDDDLCAADDDDVYLVCLSKGRDVFNSLERARDIKGRLL